MKRLININYWVWIIVFIIVAFSISFIAILLTKQIEETVDASLFVDDNHSNSLIATSDVAYKISTGDKITFKINDKYYYCEVGNMFWDEDKQVYFEIRGLNFELIPNTQLNVKIVIDTHSYASILFG